MLDSFRAKRTLQVGSRTYHYFALDAVRTINGAALDRLPISIRILLENLLRHEDGEAVTADEIAAVACSPSRQYDSDIAFYPVRVVTPDSSGVPLMADLSAMREGMERLGGNPGLINPCVPVDIIVDHSVTVDHWGSANALRQNMHGEYAHNGERYALLKWSGQSFDNIRLFPPGSGIIHQINLEYLSRPVWSVEVDGQRIAFPDTLVGLDSHIPMINGLGVLGWGVGGIEAASVMLGEPITIGLPEVVGCRLVGRRKPGISSTDIVLTVTQRLRAKGVTGKLVEFAGPGAAALGVADRATIANMAPEYGATMGFFPIDGETIRYLRMTGRSEEDIALAEAYAKAQGLWGTEHDGIAFSDIVEIDLSEVEPSVAGPTRPQDRNPLSAVGQSFTRTFPNAKVDAAEASPKDGDIVIAAITSCTNTSNPSVLIAAGLLARNARAKGLKTKPWVKSSLSPGSLVVADYLAAAGLQEHLDALSFQIVGFGCMTCAGMSGKLDAPVADAIATQGLNVAAVLSANRNFQGRIHPSVAAVYLCSPALVVAYAIAGTVLIDLGSEPLGHDPSGAPVYLKDIWPSDDEIEALVARYVRPEVFGRSYDTLEQGDAAWNGVAVPEGMTFEWDEKSTYLRRPPYFEEITQEPTAQESIVGARPLLILGDGVTTDHISPAGSIPKDGSAGRFLASLGVRPEDLHSFLARRVNHDVMIRGAFSNRHLKNLLLPEGPGGHTRHFPDGAILTIFDAAMRYVAEGVPTIIVAGRDYGTGSSRDWAAKAPSLLGIRAVLAESFERIHRSNLVGMGILPLQLAPGTRVADLRFDGTELFDIPAGAEVEPRSKHRIRIRRVDGSVDEVEAIYRIHTDKELEWYRHRGVLPYVLRRLLANSSPDLLSASASATAFRIN